MKMPVKISLLLSLIGVVSVMLSFESCSSGHEDPVVKAEDVFINEIYSVGNDWLELYNASESVKDVGGYLIYDDATAKYALPAGTTIPAKGFLVLTCDGTGMALHTNFKLSSSGETVYLETAAKKLIDMATFPALLTGQSYARYPDGTGSFAVTGLPTPGATNGDSQSPAISDVAKQPLVPSASDNIKVSVTVKDNTSLSSVKLYYRLNNAAFSSVTMSLTTNSIYEGTIPATAADGTVQYYIEAKNSNNKTSLSPADAPTSTYNFLINSDALPALVINEFLASSVSCCPDTDGGTAEYDDWIEIYNESDAPINIAGMHLSDNPDDPFKFKVPDTNSEKTTIPAHGYLIIWADGDGSQGELHANFKLSAQGETVGLYYIDGRTIDERTFGAQSDDVSSGRSSDGSLTWTTFNTPTPGAANL
jgi:hypothetical protein